jgi:hypothetical protein
VPGLEPNTGQRREARTPGDAGGCAIWKEASTLVHTVAQGLVRGGAIGKRRSARRQAVASMEKTAVAMVDKRTKSGKRGCKDVQVFDGGVSALERQGGVARCESGAA